MRNRSRERRTTPAWPSIPDAVADTRRGAAPADEAYLKRVGERVRLARARRGMSRKSLSKASGVSERYLAELERGAGNASLLVLRQIAEALEHRGGRPGRATRRSGPST